MKEDLRTFWRTYFNFTKGEKNALCILVILTVLVSAYPFFDAWISHSPPETDFSVFETFARRQKDNFKNDSHEMQEAESVYDQGKAGHARFNFDPNTATVSEFVTLGFRPYVARRIEKFRTKGGRFRVKADLYKVYGVDSGLIRDLWNRIQLPEAPGISGKEMHNDQWMKKEPAKLLIEINSADTSELVKLPGIGSKLALRIVQFRNRLGGFFSLEQLHEVYGLKPETISFIQSKLILDPEKVERLNINACDENMLDAHPYIDRVKARIIVQFRLQHGPYKDMDDLKKVAVLDEAFLDKIKNYIKF